MSQFHSADVAFYFALWVADVAFSFALWVADVAFYLVLWDARVETRSCVDKGIIQFIRLMSLFHLLCGKKRHQPNELNLSLRGSIDRRNITPRIYRKATSAE